MALNKTCLCGAIISYYDKRCSKCEEERKQHLKQKNKKRYDNSKLTHERLYNTTKWRYGTRERILKKYKYMCMYTYYKEGRVIQADIVHHINLANDNNFYDEDNLIPLSFDVHERLHIIYDKGTKEDVESLKRELKEYKNRWNDEMLPKGIE